MGYPKSISLTLLEELKPTVEAMLALLPEASLVLRGSASAIKRQRDGLYSYLRINNLKPSFKIKQISTEELIVIRMSSPKITICSEGICLLSPALKDLFEREFLLLSSDDEVMEKLQLLMREGILSSKESIEILEQWNTVQGKEKDQV